jgi:hypothetical protein
MIFKSSVSSPQLGDHSRGNSKAVCDQHHLMTQESAGRAAIFPAAGGSSRGLRR